MFVNYITYISISSLWFCWLTCALVFIGCPLAWHSDSTMCLESNLNFDKKDIAYESQASQVSGCYKVLWMLDLTVLSTMCLQFAQWCHIFLVTSQASQVSGCYKMLWMLDLTALSTLCLQFAQWCHTFLVTVSANRIWESIYQDLDATYSCFKIMNGTHEFGCRGEFIVAASFVGHS